MSGALNNELTALIRLIDEPDKHNYIRIRDKIVSYGPGAIPVLEDTWENSFNDEIQQRIENIIHAIQFKDVADALRNWGLNEEDDLLKGFFLISRYQYPDLMFEEVEKQLDKLIQNVWLEINDNLTALEKIKVINYILFNVHKFSGNKTNIQAAQNYFINTLLETRKGSPVTLSAIYILIARALKIPVYGVNLPQHFILAYTDEKPVPHGDLPGSENVLFYINPFNKGTVFTHSEIDTFLTQLKVDPDESYYAPCSNKTIIKRILNNLVHSYDKLGYPEKRDEINLLLDCL